VDGVYFIVHLLIFVRSLPNKSKVDFKAMKLRKAIDDNIEGGEMTATRTVTSFISFECISRAQGEIITGFRVLEVLS
jgi:hypothetical protein